VRKTRDEKSVTKNRLDGPEALLFCAVGRSMTTGRFPVAKLLQRKTAGPPARQADFSSIMPVPEGGFPAFFISYKSTKI